MKKITHEEVQRVKKLSIKLLDALCEESPEDALVAMKILVGHLEELSTLKYDEILIVENQGFEMNCGES